MVWEIDLRKAWCGIDLRYRKTLLKTINPLNISRYLEKLVYNYGSLINYGVYHFFSEEEELLCLLLILLFTSYFTSYLKTLEVCLDDGIFWDNVIFCENSNSL